MPSSIAALALSSAMQITGSTATAALLFVSRVFIRSDSHAPSPLLLVFAVSQT